MRKKFALGCIGFSVITAACQRAEPAPQPTEGPQGWVQPTATLRVWATIAPDNIETPTPTPTLPPIRLPLLGRIAFQSDRDGSLEIYVANADGTFTSRLTNNPAVDVFPA